MNLESRKRVIRNLYDPPIRDTAMAPSNGYLVLRVFFDNPGFNAAHCHIEPHSVNGMFLVFMVGTEKQILLQHRHQNHFYEPKFNNVCV